MKRRVKRSQKHKRGEGEGEEGEEEAKEEAAMAASDEFAPMQEIALKVREMRETGMENRHGTSSVPKWTLDIAPVPCDHTVTSTSSHGSGVVDASLPPLPAPLGPSKGPYVTGT